MQISLELRNFKNNISKNVLIKKYKDTIKRYKLFIL